MIILTSKQRKMTKCYNVKKLHFMQNLFWLAKCIVGFTLWLESIRNKIEERASFGSKACFSEE